jgi:hypothetical protein
MTTFRFVGIDLVEFVTGPCQHLTLRQGDRRQVRREQIELSTLKG